MYCCALFIEVSKLLLLYMNSVHIVCSVNGVLHHVLEIYVNHHRPKTISEE